jgi:hypothetical protein
MSKKAKQFPRSWFGKCVRCGRDLRPTGTLKRDWPGTIVHSAQGMDSACYLAHRKEVREAEAEAAALTVVEDDPYRWRQDLRDEEVAVLVQIRERFGRSEDARQLSIALGFFTVEGVSPTVVGDYVAMQH